MKAIITVIGKDTIGILAKVTGICAECEANVLDVTQTILQDLFAMIMLADVSRLTVPFDAFAENLVKEGEAMNLRVYVMHEDIFNSMHKI
jgi:ACT domain-containing protein